ncbi:ribose phosphate diphosphokinase subunit PRS1 [Aspergillus ibericus CBS 121593]|uniref:Ribose-phosphate pyrophosphokinase 1 n=1 Tax=Aspergillus ibericus CBS 121593 TaxID=1448316 RepID=A0A395GRR3_9EURO|nr:ribose phosphate diphosphokinase Prs1 [Aspergillus ibericus CBS 121593]RAK97914.1 ribose phosphate diphosphokinase Prs1 [Aspergillus ibericus CBS 121593]
MRGVQIFSGTSHPLLAETICERLGTQPARADLGKFSNGETSVNIGVSVRNQDVYIVQSGSGKINDSVMELLIMISACKGGSAKSITAVMPYFPYSRQSKKKSHRGAITARMLANLLSIAGVDHVITLDLHASQMQGFFGKPVDNLFAEPFIARWIRMNVPGWREAVVVSKNAGGTKRVTSLADTLKLNFGIVTTDRRRPKIPMAMTDSTVFFDSIEEESTPSATDKDQDPFVLHLQSANSDSAQSGDARGEPNANMESLAAANYLRPETPTGARRPSELEAAHEYTDVRVREVITGRLVQGHLVDDDYPSTGPTSHPASGETTPGQNHSRDDSEAVPDSMVNSLISNTSSLPGDHALGGSFDAAESSDEEGSVGKHTEQEKTITLVGDVRGRTVFLVDDMIDKSKSWTAAAETVVKKGGAKKVYCIATHGLFTEETLEQMEACEAIDHIVVTNSFPVPPHVVKRSKKLIVIDISSLLAESIRRHHYGESVSALFHLTD